MPLFLKSESFCCIIENCYKLQQFISVEALQLLPEPVQFVHIRHRTGHSDQSRAVRGANAFDAAVLLSYVTNLEILQSEDHIFIAFLWD